MPAFDLESFQNPYLADGADRVDAIVAVTATEEAAAGPPADLVLGFIIDTSGSMEGARIDAVRAAVETAIQLLGAGDRFFVVEFANYGRVVVPTSTASPQRKAEAARLVEQLAAAGGTAMSQGLAAARALFANAPGAIAECIFLTDGKNESELPSEVKKELDRCEGVFSCDCWGIGTDWQIGEVQEIATRLLGKASLLPDPGAVEPAFRAAVGKAQSKSIKDVRLRVWTPAGAEILSCKQVSPTIEDLTARGVAAGPQVHDFPTGAWGPGEERDYQLALRVSPGHIGDEMLAGRPSMAFVGADGLEADIKAPGARIFARWTTDDSLSSRLDATVAHYNGQDELAVAIQDGLEARERGDDAKATQLLGRAVQIAHQSDNAETTARLKKVVEVIDPDSGTVKLRRSVAKEAAMDLQLESTTTRRARRAGSKP